MAPPGDTPNVTPLCTLWPPHCCGPANDQRAGRHYVTFSGGLQSAEQSSIESGIYCAQHWRKCLVARVIVWQRPFYRRPARRYVLGALQARAGVFE